MTAFHEVQFPPSVSMGAIGGARFSTSIVTLSGGTEQRNINWANRRGEWDVSHGLKTVEQIEALIAFFHARFGMAYGFRFKDWSDFQLPRWRETPGDVVAVPITFTTDGATQTFQIRKPYGDAGNTYYRPIYKPIAATVRVLANGVEVFSPASWTVVAATGIITLGSALYTTTGTTIAVVCEFDTPARFDTDDLKVTVTMVDNYSWGAIPVIETREIA